MPYLVSHAHAGDKRAWQDPHSLWTMRLVVDDGQSLDIPLTSFLAPYRDGPAAAGRSRAARAAVD
jgi:hypothetical protein